MEKKDMNMITKLEDKFKELTEILYDTEVPVDEMFDKALPYIAEDIFFRDPWQHGGGLELYKTGMKGFHCMLNFDFETAQSSVHLDKDGKGGRAIIDGVMHLRQFSWIYVYPLRTIIEKIMI
eukprot:TRINITY_DN5663_c0_g1_i1.p1 TRINITY_DN5663_c0_g1~~TRINITY_DN5663_c0_g1_i1.p1  ORF type:complete len:122 (+),score=39.47 TRINITY_DN5663_c0_g1_i1:178-543(+)